MAAKETIQEDEELPAVEAEENEEVVVDEKKPAKVEADEAVDGAEDERVAADSEAVEERKLGRRAKWRAKQKIARERDLAVLKIENEQLRRFQHEVSARFASDDQHRIQQNIGNIEQRINQARARVAEAESYIAKAMEAGDGVAMTQALKVMREADWEAKSLEAARGNIVESAKRAYARPPQQEQRRPAPDPVVKALTDDYRVKHAWLDAPGNETDSARLHAIDNQIAVEGFTPNTQAYWDELNDRAREELPHRFKGRGGPAVGTRYERTIDGGMRTMQTITPAQKKAMQDAGYWDDPVKRAKVLARYKEQARTPQGG